MPDETVFGLPLPPLDPEYPWDDGGEWHGEDGTPIGRFPAD